MTKSCMFPSIGRGRSVAVHVARGLVYLHANNIVHLDLKSQVCTGLRHVQIRIT